MSSAVTEEDVVNLQEATDISLRLSKLMAQARRKTMGYMVWLTLVDLLYHNVIPTLTPPHPLSRLVQQ